MGTYPFTSSPESIFLLPLLSTQPRQFSSLPQPLYDDAEGVQTNTSGTTANKNATSPSPQSPKLPSFLSLKLNVTRYSLPAFNAALPTSLPVAISTTFTFPLCPAAAGNVKEIVCPAAVIVVLATVIVSPTSVAFNVNA